METSKFLTEEEIAFCELYINGLAPYAGNAMRCYYEIFPKNSTTNPRTAALRLLNQPHIQAYIDELNSLNAIDAKHKREYLARHLENIIEETATGVYKSRYGNVLSPAAIRSVCVQAMKLYADLYPVKEAQVKKLNIDSNGGGITFNVIVPNQNKDKED